MYPRNTFRKPRYGECVHTKKTGGPWVGSETVNGTPDVFYGIFEPTSFLDDRIVIVLCQLGDKRRRLRHEPDQLGSVRLP